MRGGGRCNAGSEESFADVHLELFWRAIYLAKTRPDPGSQSGSRACRVLRSKYIHIMWKFNILTAIVIPTLIQIHTYQMGSSVFSAMNRLKSASTARASILSMPSRDRTNIEKYFHCSCQFLLHLSFFFSQQTRSLSIFSCL